MYFVISERDVLLNAVPRGGRTLELGVYTGDHAALMLSTIQPTELHLVDYWEYHLDEHIPFPDVPEHFSRIEAITKQYMGDDPGATLERCYQHTVRRFEDEPRVTIRRMPTSAAVGTFEDAYFDLIYVDANHQYEHVLRDLLEYAPKLKRGGLMILNDHYDSPQGRMQNLGIIGAAAAFTKRSDFSYVALTSEPWADMAITNDPSSEYCRAFVDNLMQAPTTIIELPDQLAPNYSHKLVATSNGASRHMPSF